MVALGGGWMCGCSRVGGEVCMVAPRGTCVVAPGGGGAVCGCSRGHAWLLPGGCMVALRGGHAWLLPGGICGCSWGVHVVAPGGGGCAWDTVVMHEE